MVEIVAEISGNHGGNLFKARELIIAAADAGCDYVKFQYYDPIEMPDYSANKAMYWRLAVHPDWLPPLFEIAKDCSIGLFASVFSEKGAKEILEYDVPYIKLASPKSTRLLPETYEQIAEAVPADVKIIASADEESAIEMSRFLGIELFGGNSRLLYCPEGHPPTITRVNLRNFTMGEYWGFSDHTPGIRTPLAFIRVGAQMIEKHLKTEGDNDCVDAAFSADPKTMKQLCRLAHGK